MTAPFLSTESAEVPEQLLSRARNLPQARVAVVNAISSRVLQSAWVAADEGLSTPVLIGDPADIRTNCKALGWDIQGLDIVPAATAQDAAHIAVEMAAANEVDAILKGDVGTDVLMRVVLDRASGLRTERHLSHVFHMSMPGCDRALFVTDAVLNVHPTVEQKTDIACNALALMSAVGLPNPRLAILSASEKVSKAMPSTQDADVIRQKLSADESSAAIVDGPMALDLALSKDAANVKNYESEVAGSADAILVPNIETGNALFKAMVYLRSATAAGLVLGASVPIALTSRSDPAEARIASLALATISANSN